MQKNSTRQMQLITISTKFIHRINLTKIIKSNAVKQTHPFPITTPMFGLQLRPRTIIFSAHSFVHPLSRPAICRLEIKHNFIDAGILLPPNPLEMSRLLKRNSCRQVTKHIRKHFHPHRQVYGHVLTQQVQNSYSCDHCMDDLSPGIIAHIQSQKVRHQNMDVHDSGMRLLSLYGKLCQVQSNF